jgi:hypothetical protein
MHVEFSMRVSFKDSCSGYPKFSDKVFRVLYVKKDYPRYRVSENLGSGILKLSEQKNQQKRKNSPQEQSIAPPSSPQGLMNSPAAPTTTSPSPLTSMSHAAFGPPARCGHAPMPQ